MIRVRAATPVSQVEVCGHLQKSIDLLKPSETRDEHISWFPEMGVPQNGWFTMEAASIISRHGCFRKPPDEHSSNRFL